jgi:glutamyl-tRNA synthetase
LSEKVRVRFAPSPTGHLHIGGARTALFNWLFARHNKGDFILRIEDTDRTRSTDEYIDSIMEGMRWLNLDWDEGPFRQTDRFVVYRAYADRLVEEGKAYHCYCSPEELEERRKEALSQGKSLKYDGRCRDLKEPVPGRKPAIRFMMPGEGKVVVRDMIRGEVVFDNSLLDDLIIVRSDGTPTYNFTVVADDVDMKITHVIRGDDHLNNTPKQIHICSALGCRTPLFAHLPMILGSDKARLSKRHGATSVIAYREAGYLPEALVNYLVRLGWSCGDQEVFTVDELIKHFSFDAVGKSAAVFNPEKLLWLNSRYIMSASPGRLANLVKPFLVGGKIIEEGRSLDEQWLSRAVFTLQERSKTLVELAGSLSYYIADEIAYDLKAREKFLNRKYLANLEAVKESLDGLGDFTAGELEKVFHSIAEKYGAKLGSIAQPLRVAVTGRTESPGIFEVLEVLGKEKTMKRLDMAIRMIHEG